MHARHMHTINTGYDVSHTQLIEFLNDIRILEARSKTTLRDYMPHTLEPSNPEVIATK